MPNVCSTTPKYCTCDVFTSLQNLPQIEFIKCSLLRHLFLNLNKILRNFPATSKKTKQFKNLIKDYQKCKLSVKVSHTNCQRKIYKNFLSKKCMSIKGYPHFSFRIPRIIQTNFVGNIMKFLTKNPLHDVSHYSQDLYEEIPNHLPIDFKQSLRKIIHNSFNRKEVKNSSKYRENLLNFCIWLT